MGCGAQGRRLEEAESLSQQLRSTVQKQEAELKRRERFEHRG